MASLHHIDKLTETLNRCDEALAPGGVLWAFEYVGPDRSEYPTSTQILPGSSINS
jgi:hypothetical protein